MTQENLQKAIKISSRIKHIDDMIKRAQYTQHDTVLIRTTFLSGNGFESIDVPESLFRIIGKLIISEYQQELLELQQKLENL